MKLKFDVSQLDWIIQNENESEIENEKWKVKNGKWELVQGKNNLIRKQFAALRKGSMKDTIIVIDR